MAPPVTRTGTGPPLLALMGVGGTARHWGRRFVARLEAERTLLRLDLTHAEQGSTTHLGQLAAAAVDGLGLERVEVVGLSLGGMVAQELALARPDLVASLTLIGTSAGGPDAAPPPQDTLDRLQRAFASGDRQRAMAAFTGLCVADPAAVAEVEPGSDEVPLDVVVAQLAAAAQHDAADRLPHLAAPTRVVHGALDRIAPVANAHHLTQLLPHAALDVVPGAGHVVPWERPDEAAALVLGGARR